MSDSDAPPPHREPIFNLPGIVIISLAGLVAIHVLRLNLPRDQFDWSVLAFIPRRIGQTAAIWSFLTYALLHADWGHLALNCLGLAAFGSPLARRFGAARFLIFSAIGAISGALLFLLLHPGEGVALIGASAAISAQMAGASRFVFGRAGPLQYGDRPEAYRRPAQPLAALARDNRVVVFVAVWFGANLVFGLLGSNSGLASGPIAWEAHVGGFVAGLLLFSLFDPIPVAAPADPA